MLKSIIEILEKNQNIDILNKALKFIGKVHLGDNFQTEEDLEAGEKAVSQEYYEDYGEYLKHAK